MRTIILSFTFCILSFSNFIFGQRVYPPEIKNAEVVTYKTIGDVDMKLWIFNPKDHEVSDTSPAIVFFFGGGWNSGSPSQFVPHCEYLAERGMVSIVADYRVRSRNGVTPDVCISDAKSAIRWVREHSGDLGIDPNRIVGAGGSAGGHLAASCALLSGFEADDENQTISSKPNALVLFNPVLLLAPAEPLSDLVIEKMDNLIQRMGDNPALLSPYHHIEKNKIPTIIFHGTEDNTVPFETIALFENKMREKGNNCTLVAYEGEPHGFFNFGRKANGPYIDTVHKMDEFLVSLGYLISPPKATIFSN